MKEGIDISLRRRSRLGIHTHLIDRIAMVNGILSGMALWPQVLQIMMTGNTAGLSPLSFGILFVNNLVWVAYSLHRALISLLIASLLNVMAAGSMLLLILV